MMAPTIPGSLIARVTKWWMRWYEYLGKNEEVITSLHKKYGPIVRLAPSHVSVSSAEGIQNVYTISRKLDRPAALVLFHNFKSENMVSTVDAYLHLERRKLVRTLYGLRAVESASTQTFLKGKMEKLGQCIEDVLAKGAEVDVYPLFRWLGVDFMSHIVYGEEFALNLVEKREQREMMQYDIATIDNPGMPWWAWLSNWFPNAVLWLRHWNLASSNLDGSMPDYMAMKEISYSALKLALRASVEASESSETLMQRLIAHYKVNGPTAALPNHDYILSECFDHFSAGISTTASALSAITYELSLPLNQERQRRLRNELRTLKSEILPSDLKSLKYLDCVIRETLRLHPPIELSLGRRIPPTQKDGIPIHGFTCPVGTEVSAQAHSVHRDETAFPDSEKWEPERWETAEPEQLKLMKRQFFAFGAGPRMCIGMNLAWNVLRHTVCKIYSEYETSLGSKWIDEKREVVGMIERGKKGLWPDGRREPLTFKRL